jgi:hypothetical protein
VATGSNAAPVQAFDGCPAVIVEVFGDRAADACYVAWRESSYRAGATGSRGEKGYFQIHPVHGAKSTYDPYLNTLYAYQMSNGGWNWCPTWGWTC